MKRIFILEDSDYRIEAFITALLRPGIDLSIAQDVAGAIKGFEPPYDLLLLDHDLGGEAYVSSTEYNTGSEFARHLTRMEWPADMPLPQIVIHSWNPDGALAMEQELTKRFKVVDRFPFGQGLLEGLKVL